MEEIQNIVAELKSRKAMWLDMMENDNDPKAQEYGSQLRLKARIAEIDSIIDWLVMEYEL